MLHKRLRKCLICLMFVAMIVSLMPKDVFAAGNSYTVTYDLIGMTADGPTRIENSETLNVILNVKDGFEIPNPMILTVKVGDKTLSKGSDYTIMNTGKALKISVFGRNITDDVVIKAEAEKINYSSNANLSGITYLDVYAMKSYSLSDEQLQEATSEEGVHITLSHGNMDGQYMIINCEKEDKNAKAVFNCQSISEHKVVLNADVSSEIIKIGCMDNGEIKYTASVTFDGKEYTDERFVKTDPAGHKWGEPVWTWTDDHSKATVTFVCQNDNSHTESIAAAVTSRTYDASCLEEGSVVYTATAEFNGKTYTDSKTVVIPAIGHQLGKEWKSDENNHWKECSNCEEKMNEAAHVFEWVKDKEATETETGFMHEECKICGYRKAMVEIPATGSGEEPSKPVQPVDDTDKENITEPSETNKQIDNSSTSENNKNGKTDAPETGTISSTSIWTLLMILGGISFIGIYAYSRKKKSSR